jgi:hypothetical protein
LKGKRPVIKSMKIISTKKKIVRKLFTFRKVLAKLNPSIFFIEESKYKTVGKVKFENYVIFELVRQNKTVDSDNFTQIMDLDLKVVREKPKREEIYIFKNREGQEKFKNLSSETDDFSKCFLSEKSILSQVKDWQDTLEAYCKKSFRKIRINLAKLGDGRG